MILEKMMALQDFISKYDNLETKGLDESEIVSGFGDKDAKGNSYYEVLAFEFCEYPNDESWNDFYSYMSDIPLVEGKILSNISKSEITEEALFYWNQRKDSAVSSLFKT